MKNKRAFNILLFTALFILTSGYVFSSVELRGSHKDNEVPCADCHGTDNPDKPAKTSACFSCHGDYASLAELTKDLPEANPHDSHLGPIDCTECHGIHKPSVIYCNQECHNFDMNIK